MNIIISKGRNRYRFYALFALSIFLLFCNYSLQISIPSVVIVAVLTITALLGDKDELISICVCCIAWSEAIKSHYITILCSVIILLKYRDDLKLDFGIVPILLIVIWEFLHWFSGEMHLMSWIAYPFMYLLFIFIFFIRDLKTIDYSFIMRNFAIAVFGVCCVLILRLLIHNNFSFDKLLLEMQRFGQTDEEIGGLIINPNSLGVLCVLAIGCLLQVRFAGEKKIIDIFLIVLILVLGALTCSRTYLACLLILCVFLLLVSDMGMKTKLKFLFGSVTIFFLSVWLLNLLFPSTLEFFIYRLNAKDITSGRDVLFYEYNKYLMSSSKAFLLGLGSLSLGEKVKQLSIAAGVPHNGIQEILVAWGIVGLLLFGWMIFVMIRRSKQENPQQSIANYALLIVLFAKIMVGQIITSTYTMLSFILIYITLCHNCKGKRIK